MQFFLPSSLPLPTLSTLSPFLFGKGLTSQEYQPNMAYNVEIKLGSIFPSKAELVNPVGGKSSPKQ